MRATQWFTATLREAPADAKLVSHQLMLRAGMIRKLGSGLYTWLPLGLRVLRKIEQIVREEMNRAGALEVLMPAVQPREIWEETGRWETFGGQLLTMKDSNGREYCFGPTHEEVITDLVRNEIKSYKELPLNFYQIQTKFRDEIRPRFGVMRAREFLMKDAYSFDIDEAGLQKNYDRMYATYCRIFTRLGLAFRAVEADTGAIGGSRSHEFQVLADSGEDVIFYSDGSDYAANVEQAKAKAPAAWDKPAEQAISKIATPDKKTIDEVAAFLNTKPEYCLKTLIVKGRNHPMVALVLRGSDSLNEVKAAKHPLVHDPIVFIEDAEVEKTLGCPVGYIGPIGLNIPVIMDEFCLAMPHFVAGANEASQHFQHGHIQRDLAHAELGALRTVVEGDDSPDGKGKLKSCRGIEVGHVFQLGKKYADAMKAQVLNEQGQLSTLWMGCYGVGVSRLVAAAIEQHFDARGIIWPANIAPFKVVVIPVNGQKCPAALEKAEALYQTLLQMGIDALLDDRAERPGVLFADNDLIGIPHRIVISDKLLAENKVEYKARAAESFEILSLDEALTRIQTALHQEH